MTYSQVKKIISIIYIFFAYVRNIPHSWQSSIADKDRTNILSVENAFCPA